MTPKDTPPGAMEMSEARLADELERLDKVATPGPFAISGVSLDTGSVSVRHVEQRIIIAEFTNAASFGDFIREALERRTFGSPDAAKTQYANVDLYIKLRNNTDTIIAALRQCATLRAQVQAGREALESAESALDLYGNEDHWQGDTFRPVRLEAHCKCLCCYEAYSDKGERARVVVAEVERALAQPAKTEGAEG